MNISLVFPGVGSQYSGMGKTQYHQYKIVRDTFDEVSEIAKTRDADLNILANAQICLFTLSIAYYRLLNNYLPVSPQCCCGYSLGEYSALCSAGAFGIRNAVELIELRSTILQKITDSNIGRYVRTYEMPDIVYMYRHIILQIRQLSQAIIFQWIKQAAFLKNLELLLCHSRWRGHIIVN